MSGRLNQKWAERNSSIELARIVAMLLITIGHFTLAFGLFFVPKDTFISSSDILSVRDFLPHIALYSLCVVGVNLFILISGYFQIRLTWKSLFSFIVLCIFYNALVFIADSLVNDAFSIRRLAKVFIVSKTVNWFFPVYFILMIVSPLLNLAINSLDLKNLRIVVFLIFILNCISGFVFHNENVNGYNAYQFCFLYILGSWLRQDPVVTSRKRRFYFLVYILGSLLLSALAVGILHFTTWSLRTLYYYNNPLIVITSVSLFIVFAKSSFKSVSINVFASTVVAALFIQHILFLTASPFIHAHSVWFVPLYVILIFLVAFLIELPRLSLTNRILGSFPKNLSATVVDQSLS